MPDCTDLVAYSGSDGIATAAMGMVPGQTVPPPSADDDGEGNGSGDEELEPSSGCTALGDDGSFLGGSGSQDLTGVARVAALGAALGGGACQKEAAALGEAEASKKPGASRGGKAV
eukprot:4733627-Lingulodinium_polyedra.AAC.1